MRCVHFSTLFLSLSLFLVSPPGQAASDASHLIPTLPRNITERGWDNFHTTSENGRFVVFDRYVYDRNRKVLTAIADPHPPFEMGVPESIVISGDGRYVAFMTFWPEHSYGIFVYDRLTDNYQVVVDQIYPPQLNQISHDGQYVLFSTDVSLVPEDTNEPLDPAVGRGGFDVYLWDRRTRALSLESVDADGNQANVQSENPSMTANARFLVYSTFDVDSNERVMYLKDRARGTVEQLSPGNVHFSEGGPAAPVISAQGRYIGFIRVPRPLFVMERETGHTQDVNLHDGGSSPTILAEELWFREVAFPWDQDYLLFRATQADGKYVHNIRLNASFRTDVYPNQLMHQGVGTDGLIVLEAEQFADQQTSGQLGWSDAYRDNVSVSAVVAVPKQDVKLELPIGSGHPRLDYRVRFNRIGKHYVFVRGIAPTDSDDSLWIGVNGRSARMISGFSPTPTWQQRGMDGVIATVHIDQIGEQILNLWMREDGLVVDKILLTTTPKFVPEGLGDYTYDAVTPPMITPAGGSFVGAQTISMEVPGTPSAEIYFTLDGSEPQIISDHRYVGPVVIAETTTVRAVRSYTVWPADGDGFETTSSESVAGFQKRDGVGPIYAQGDGGIALEVERFTASAPSGLHAWYEVFTADASWSAMAAWPNVGFNLEAHQARSGPRLDYVVRFNKPGTYYVWLRGAAETSRDNSAHVGLNGRIQSSAGTITGFGSHDDMGAHNAGRQPRENLVPAPGLHTINIWMREDGVVLDRILMMQEPGFMPVGKGPGNNVLDPSWME